MAVTIKNTAENTCIFCQITVNQCCFLKQYSGTSTSANFHTVKFLIPIIHYFHICHWFSHPSSLSYLQLPTAQKHWRTRNPCTKRFSHQFFANFVIFYFIFSILFMWMTVHLLRSKVICTYFKINKRTVKMDF
jgi:hypothetical protein